MSVAKKLDKKQTSKIADRKASQFAFKSKLTKPLNDMTLAEKSLFFAEVSFIAYMSPQECNIAAGKLGFTDGKFFNCDGSQAYWFQNEHDSVIVCRGTEANEWNDIQADANALTAIAETVGKVHRGFKKEVDDLWPYIEEALQQNTKPLWFTGHSLGGAMATICAGRCLLSHVKSEPEGLFTYGSPRVGCKRYVSYTNIPHFRWVNNNDVVTRVPPIWLGYRHCGTEMYLNRHGKLKDIKGWRRVSDRFQGLLKEFTTKFRIDYLSDHSIQDYVDLLGTLTRNDPDLINAVDSNQAGAKPATEQAQTKEVVKEQTGSKPESKPVAN